MEGSKMTKREMNSDAQILLSRILIILGIITLAAGFAANLVGLSVDPDISMNQIGFIMLGIVLISAGILGRKFVVLYKKSAVMILNILVAVFLFEMLSIALLKIVDNERFSSLWRRADEGGTLQTERKGVCGSYAPYVIWRFNVNEINETISVDTIGRRITPGNPADPDAFEIWVFGGSSVWGAGNCDDGTIPAELQSIMNERSIESVRVLNMGQIAWSSTQEVIELTLLLRAGERPDLVVFFDGFNDIWGSYESGRTGVHHSESRVASLLNGTAQDEVSGPFMQIVMRSNTWLLTQSLRRMFFRSSITHQDLITYRTMGVNVDSLSRGIAETWLANMENVIALSEYYGFRVIGILQPSLWYSGKRPTDYEEEILAGKDSYFLAGGDPDFSELYCKACSYLEQSAASVEWFHSYSDVLDDIAETAYTDVSGVHVTREANRLIAEKLAQHIIEIEPELVSLEDSIP